MARIDTSDVLDMAIEQVKWYLDNNEPFDSESLADSAREAMREGVNWALIYTADVVDTWIALGRPDYPVGDIDWPDDGDLETAIRVSVECELTMGDAAPDVWEAVDEVLKDRALGVAELKGTPDDVVDDLLTAGDREALLDYVLGRGDYAE